MTDGRLDVLVLRDAGGTRDLLPWETVQRAAVPPGAAAEIAGLLEGDVSGYLDSISEMGEMDLLQLQIAMDRMSKMMSTISNLLTKVGDTQSAITQNLK
jgi:hypothetical protein